MKINVVTKNGVSTLSFQFKTDFNEVLDKNFAAICNAIANKGIILKELLSLFEKEDNSLDTIIQIMTTSRGENAAKNALSKELGISPQTAQYLLDISLENLTSLNGRKLRKMLDDYKANIGKLIKHNAIKANKRNSSPWDNMASELNSQLDPKKNFRNFIEGDSNKLARTVSLSIPENFGKSTLNPFYLYGPSSCGKTHLINAIGVRCKEICPQKRVLYVSARQFQVQFTDSVRQNSTNDFINFYQSIDVLIVDDIQEWINSPRTLNSFFHIFNHLIRNGKQIILASNFSPAELQGTDDHLIARFASGLIVEMEKPNDQLCIDILKVKCQCDDLNIPTDVIEFIAKAANGNVCYLEGVANSLMAYALVHNHQIDMDLAERIIKSI